MRIVGRPVRPASQKRRKRCGAARDSGTTGMFPLRAVVETMAMSSGATWTQRAAGLIRLNEPRANHLQTAPHPSPTTTAHTLEHHPTSTRRSLGPHLNNMTTVGWPTHTTAARFSHHLARPSPETAFPSPSPSIDQTRLPRGPIRSSSTRLTRRRPQVSPSRSRSDLRKRMAKSDTPFDQPLTLKMAPLSAQFSSLLACVKTFCAMLNPTRARVWRCAAYCAGHLSTTPSLLAIW